MEITIKLDPAQLRTLVELVDGKVDRAVKLHIKRWHTPQQKPKEG